VFDIVPTVCILGRTTTKGVSMFRQFIEVLPLMVFLAIGAGVLTYGSLTLWSMMI